jgi:protein-S-isoprenylcysteine O-methyltransferase Ste14
MHRQSCILASWSSALVGNRRVHRETTALIALTLATAVLVHKIVLEDPFLVEQFGPRYIEYRRKVKALLPFVW